MSDLFSFSHFPQRAISWTLSIFCLRQDSSSQAAHVKAGALRRRGIIISKFLSPLCCFSRKWIQSLFNLRYEEKGTFRCLPLGAFHFLAEDRVGERLRGGLGLGRPNAFLMMISTFGENLETGSHFAKFESHAQSGMTRENHLIVFAKKQVFLLHT